MTYTKIKCDCCGVEFERETRKVNEAIKKGRKQFCSNICRKIGTKIKCECKTCGKYIYKTRTELNKSKSGYVFCSKSCACSYNNKTLRVGVNNPNWIDGRFKTTHYAKKAFRSYKHECVVCGFNNDKALEVHHIDKNRDNDDLDNLIILCANCHCLVHYDGMIITNDIKLKRKIKI